jgi:hypothetical protein
MHEMIEPLISYDLLCLRTTQISEISPQDKDDLLRFLVTPSNRETINEELISRYSHLPKLIVDSHAGSYLIR